MNCLLKLNPLSGFAPQHSDLCAMWHQHMDGEVRVNGIATHHALFGVSKEHPNGSACLNVCSSCASKAEKRGAIISEGIIQ